VKEPEACQRDMGLIDQGNCTNQLGQRVVVLSVVLRDVLHELVLEDELDERPTQY
jgi:hypothetical protein